MKFTNQIACLVNKIFVPIFEVQNLNVVDNRYRYVNPCVIDSMKLLSFVYKVTDDDGPAYAGTRAHGDQVER